MKVISTTRSVSISAFKAREVTREIQGLPATDAMALLQIVPKKAAFLIRKTLATAIANAENNNNLQVSSLTVQEAVVGEGPTAKRFQPKARGSAGPIRKRSSHIRIVLTDELPIVRREDSKKRKKSTAGKSRPTKAAAAAAESQAAPSAETPDSGASA